MYYLDWLKNRLPLHFSVNSSNKKKNKFILILALKKIEYKGKSKIFDKNFNFIVEKCLKVTRTNSSIYLNNFEIVFIRGENIINFLWLK